MTELGRRALRLLLFTLLALAASVHGEDRLRLTTTTSTESSGLLEALLPPFELQSGIRVEVLAVGSGKALKLAENGDADVVLSHAPQLEERFLEAGYGVNPRPVMVNDFVFVGPPADPASIRGLKDGAEALRRIAKAGARFVSRGDGSGTHEKEKQLWGVAGVEPAPSSYLEAGQGMGPVLVMAGERQAYTLTDRGTLLAFRRNLDLALLVEGDRRLLNRYTVIAVNPARHPHVRHGNALALIEFLTGAEGQGIIADFRVGGEPLFRPLAIPSAGESPDRGR